MQNTRSLAPTFGAEVSDYTISSTTSNEENTAIKALWAKHKLLLFRNQNLDEETLVSFSRVFGDLEIHVRTEYLSSDFPEVLYVSNMKNNGKKMGILADTEVGLALRSNLSTPPCRWFTINGPYAASNWGQHGICRHDDGIQRAS